MFPPWGFLMQFPKGMLNSGMELLIIGLERLNLLNFSQPYLLGWQHKKWTDGFIAQKNGHSKWITNEKSRNAVHQLRSSCDAILVGNNTVTKDNPKLTSHGVGKNPKILLFKGFKNEKSKINVLENVKSRSLKPHIIIIHFNSYIP